MVAVMIVAAFAVVGMADSGAADGSPDAKEKNILGTRDNPYILHYSSDKDKNETVTANIEFNRSAFTTNAKISFSCTFTDISRTDSKVIGTKTPTEATSYNDPNSTDNPKYSIVLSGSNGIYSIDFTGLKAHPANTYTKIAIEVSVTDKVKSNDIIITELPTQTYTFNSYLIVVDPENETIKLNGTGVDEKTPQNVTFNFEKDYVISSKVYVGEEESDDAYSYYATGLPDGISMTVDGKIGGRLSKSLKTPDDMSFTVYAVSEFGHVVSQKMTYSIGNKAVRGFSITEETSGNSPYATKTTGETVNLVITPNPGCTLSNVVVKYDGLPIKDVKSTDNKTYEASFDCEGTGIIKISVSANVDGSNVTMTKTFTIYVVGKIFDTDLDPEVTN